MRTWLSAQFAHLLTHKLVALGVTGVLAIALAGGIVIAMSSGGSSDSSAVVDRPSSLGTGPTTLPHGSEGGAASPSSAGANAGATDAEAGTPTSLTDTVSLPSVTPASHPVVTQSQIQSTAHPPPAVTQPPVTQPPVTQPPVTEPPIPQPTNPQYQTVEQTCINGTVTGWTGDTAFELCNGEVWRQAAYDYKYFYAYQPQAEILLYQGAYFLYVDQAQALVAVTQVTDYVKTCIDGSFNGWDGSTVFPLCNGQVWLQAALGIQLSLALSPQVLIYWDGTQHVMQVDGVSGTIAVTQVTDFEKTCISGEFSGWTGDTVFTLCNGEVWQQAEFKYTYHYAYNPTF